MFDVAAAVHIVIILCFQALRVLGCCSRLCNVYRPCTSMYAAVAWDQPAKRQMTS